MIKNGASVGQVCSLVPWQTPLQQLSTDLLLDGLPALVKEVILGG